MLPYFSHCAFPPQNVFLSPICQPFPQTLRQRISFNFLESQSLTAINNPPITLRTCLPTFCFLSTWHSFNFCLWFLHIFASVLWCGCFSTHSVPWLPNLGSSDPHLPFLLLCRGLSTPRLFCSAVFCSCPFSQGSAPCLAACGHSFS